MKKTEIDWMNTFYGQKNLIVEDWISIKPEYLNHEHISGNKLRKLKYNLRQAKKKDAKTLLTFGGAFSNHIAATAAAGKEYGFNTIGIIRGEEVEFKLESNPTLVFAKSQGMHLHFISREDYRHKNSDDFIKSLKNKLGDFYLLPEGGTNELAIKGCEEILQAEDFDFNYICCPVGTGGTVSGLINSSKKNQNVLGFVVLKGDFLEEEIKKYTQKTNWELITDYHFGGYAKINPDVISFINWFNTTYKLPLDPIYTGKMMYGLFKMKEAGFFNDEDRILAIHTGGLQGINGMNNLLKAKHLPLIRIDL